MGVLDEYMPADHRSSISEYRPEIDGLRAMAVVSVILFHAGFERFSGGFVGVDVFFVISGFLITKIILNDMREGTFSFLDFYDRRIRRILPALIFVMAICTLFAWFLLNPRQMEKFSQGLVAVTLFASNMLFKRDDDYFGGPAEKNPLLHTWSLGVEEQFYIVFPIVLLLLWPLGYRRVFLFICFTALISLAVSEWGWRSFRVENFFLTPTRAWELLIGSILAFASLEKPINQRLSPSWCELLSGLGLAMIVVAIFAFDKSTPFPSVYALLPTIGAALVIGFAGPRTTANRILSQKWAVGIGLISYSAYLWHQPLFAFIRIDGRLGDHWGVFAAAAIATLLLAYLTWRFVETPFRSNKLIERRSVFGIAGSLSACMIAFGAVGYSNNGFYSRFGDYNWETALNGGHTAKWVSSQESPQFILYGDSHAKHYTIALEKHFRDRGVSYNVLAHPACISLPKLTNIYHGKIHETCLDLLNQLIKQVEETGATVIISYAWGKTLADRNGTNLNLAADSDEKGKVLMQGLKGLLRRLPANQKLIIVGNVPTTKMRGGYIGCAIRRSETECAEDLPIQKGEGYNLRRHLKQLADRDRRILFVDPYVPLCDSTNCKIVDGKNQIYSDHGHLSIYGADKVIGHWHRAMKEFGKMDILSAQRLAD